MTKPRQEPRQQSGKELLEPRLPQARFEGGTLVLEGVSKQVKPPTAFQWVKKKWRCPAVHYRTIRLWLRRQNIRNVIPRWRDLDLTWQNERTSHDYQTEALQTWLKADCWGSIVLPTGAGKTYLALWAIAETKVHTLVIVPTVELLHQWYACLENAFGSKEKDISIGVWYGQEKRLEPLTVTTYPSAWAQAETLGNQFKLLIFDEIHHLPAPSWHEIALMCAAPYRLGLTATYPEDTVEQAEPSALKEKKSPLTSPKAVDSSPKIGERGRYRFQNPAKLLDDLVGPVLYRKHIDDLTGLQLAEYRTERIRINLTPEEREIYDAAYATYTGYIREARLREHYRANWWDEMTRRSAYDAQARRAKVAELNLKEVVHQARGKLMILDRLLREHAHQKMLIFTAHNRFAYEIARHFLLPVITYQTKAAERKAILDGFQDGSYRAIVTSKVLNEGVDVPEAKIAVVLGGSASAREYVQRLGRVLRKQGNAQAVLYEVIARKTVDERIAQRRQPKARA